MRSAAVLLIGLLASTTFASTTATIHKLEGSIVLDGDLADSGWASATKIDTFLEHARGDNVAPPVTTVAYVTYDERNLYVAFRCDDPKASSIRAPFVDRDQVLNDQDYVQIVIDAQNDQRSAFMFKVNPRGVQADSVYNDASQLEDPAPDFSFDAAARITATGWVAEIRIPMSSLRYADKDPQEWGVIFERNYPRDFRYLMASSKIPKGSNCYLCHEMTLAGFTGLPLGGHLTLAPYTTAARNEQLVGTPLAAESLNGNAGLDMKWSASRALTIDATVNPDFSQIESDVPQVSVNSRFALSFPEKRSFFLEGVDLFSTPLKAVYTRSISSAAWGIRATGKTDTVAYTLLAAEDRGGGSVVIPGRYGSSAVPQDFRSLALIGRVRKSIGDSFAAFLVSDREVSGGGYNRVVGPDFMWKMTTADKLTGQYLVSSTENPDRPALSPLFDGSGATGHAARLVYTRDTDHYDVFSHLIDYSPHFRTDNGFIPWADLRGTFFELGGHIYPKRGPVSYWRPFFNVGHESAWEGGGAGVYFEGKLGSSGWIEYHPAEQDVVNGGKIRYRFTEVHLKANPSRYLPSISLDGSAGQRVDYVNARLGNGATFTFTSSVRPTIHLELAASMNREWLNVSESRLYSADIDRLKATYVFDQRSIARVVAQRTHTDRTTALYAETVTPRDGDFSLSLLYGYRINWLTTFYIGYGDYRLLDDNNNRLMPMQRSVFAKASYAFQR